MILSGDFYYHGLPRWNLGWPTPNYVGAFAFSGAPWRWAALVVEAGRFGGGGSRSSGVKF